MQANILIVEDDERQAVKLKSHLKSKNEIGMVEYVTGVKEAQIFLEVKNADLVILDLIMPSYDGYFFMETVNKGGLEAKPAIIVTSAINNEVAIKKAFDMGAKYYIVKPYDEEVMYKRVLDVIKLNAQENDRITNRRKNIDRSIMEIFISIGIPPQLKGYQYLRTAVKLVLEEPQMIYNITKRLYPEVAKCFGVTPAKVELAIRHTLDVTWHRNNGNDISKAFGCDAYIKNHKPTNGEFIALVADKIFVENSD